MLVGFKLVSLTLFREHRRPAVLSNEVQADKVDRAVRGNVDIHHKSIGVDNIIRVITGITFN